MKEYMLLIRNHGDAKASLSEGEHLRFIKQCESHINGLRKEGKLIAAQPLLREGSIVSATREGWKEIPLDPDQTVQVGYYHILAENMAEATRIAKENPEFEYVPSASIEIRPVKTIETETEFIYPK